MSRAHRVLALALAALLLAACQSGGGLKNPLTRDNAPATVGRISEHHDLTSIWGLGKLVVETPSTLSVQDSAPVQPDADVAIARYEQLIALSASPRLRAEALQRAADLRLQRADAGEGAPDDLPKAIAHYETLLAQHPAHPRNDRALYQLARAYQLAGEEPRATALLRRLGDEYPDSARRAEARFRAAELLYQVRDYAAAAREYRAVIEHGGDGSYLEPAQYKYAWALYQQHEYAQALPVLLAILDRELPRGEPQAPAPALAGVAAEKAEMVAETLRLTGLSFSALGGGIAVGAQLDTADAPKRLTTLLYAALGEQLLSRQRYSDAADAYAALIARDPQHPRAADFQSRVIAAYRDGGFGDELIAATEQYAERYAADAPYWQGRSPDTETLATLRAHLDTLARHHHASAQQAADASAYRRAAHWYRRTLELYPQDAQRGPTRLLYAEALLDGGQVADAAAQFEEAAYGEAAAGFARAADAGHAAVLAYRRLTESAPAAARAAALQRQVDAGLKFADAFADHPQRSAVLAASAADLLELGAHERAITVAQQALDADATPAQQRIALSVIADARYAQADYAQAEAAYTALLVALPQDAPIDQRTPAIERLAAAVYKQGEAARAAGELRAAASLFLRVGERAPTATIRATADYDAAAALIAAEQWAQAAATLEGFRERFPAHALIADADRKLALAYDRQNLLAAAAAAYSRIAERTSEPDSDRREAAWRAAQRYDEAGAFPSSERAYERYVALFAQPVERALEARQRLADLALEQRRDRSRAMHWWAEIVAVERAAGSARSQRTRLLGAQAQLALGRAAAGDAAALPLELPLERSLAQRVKATETAIAALDAAADYGFAEITTAATYELGALYRELGRALLASRRPRQLAELELQQYELLLEEQAYPFEERAIQAHEANLSRIGQGVWNEWVQRSAQTLTDMAPARYGKHERRDTRYDSPT
ncbi:MAG: tetratricopeptide repeat protein [Gammaproteobacteria bacterium]